MPRESASTSIYLMCGSRPILQASGVKKENNVRRMRERSFNFTAARYHPARPRVCASADLLGAPSTVHAGSPMPDGKSAKKVIKGVLKQHKKGLSIEGLKKDVCKQLEAEGMTPKKAEKAFNAKIQLPIFEVKAGVARLVKNKDGDAAVAVPRLLQRHGMTVDDIDLWEVNEAFAVVSMACVSQASVPHEKMNVWGGAIAFQFFVLANL